MFIKRTLRISFVINMFLLVGLGITQIVMSNELAKMSMDLGSIEDKIADYNQKNDISEQKVASASALSTVYKKAGEMGFMPATRTIVIIPEQLPVAALNR